MMISKTAKALNGVFDVPGDKSLSHRALIFAAQAIGTTTVKGLLESEDVMNTRAALMAMGVRIEKNMIGDWVIDGVGLTGLREPSTVLDMGNSGTAARLLAGVVGARPFRSVMSGDASLNKRPMDRVTKPLSSMGIRFHARQDRLLPMMVEGAQTLTPISYDSPIASAQVKSAVLLAGFMAPGVTSVTEPRLSRDHTERMARFFGLSIDSEILPDGRARASVKGQGVLTAPKDPLIVPSDPSSAAFPICAALIVPDSVVTVRNVNLNPTRTGLFDTLLEMGADLVIENRRDQGGEPVGDITARYSGALKGVSVPASRVPSMIDEFPILSVVAAFAAGDTVMTGLEELRVKESDRLAVMAQGLIACGVSLTETPDGMIVYGKAHPPHGGAHIATHLDHRIAMSFLIMGAASQNPVSVDDTAAIATSFPAFIDKMAALGCVFTAEQQAPHKKAV